MHQATARTDIAVLTLELKGGAASRVHLLPAGEFKSVDGRPDDGLSAWKLTPEAAARIVAKVAARKTPLVFDYEHQTLNARFNGQPAPAAGWFKSVEFDAQVGLFANPVDWTAQAKAYIDADQYKFASAVFSYDRKTGEVRELLHAALTNNPGLDGLNEVSALAARHFSQSPPEDSMKQLLIAALAMSAAQAATATEDSLVTLVKELKTSADRVAGLEADVVRLTASQYSPSTHVPIAELTRLQTELQTALTQVSEFKTKATEAEVAALVEGGMAKGKIVAATKDYFTDMGKKDVAALKAYLDKQPEIPALATQQTSGVPPAAALVSSVDVPAGASVDALRAAKHTEALAYQAKHSVDYVTACKAVGIA
jgi:phage I-like protein